MPPYSGITMGSANVWSMWIDNGTGANSTMLTSQTTSQIWGAWIDQTGGQTITYSSLSGGSPRAPLTPEQRAAAQARVEKINAENAERQKKQAVIRAKARQLLEEVLDAEQKDEFAKSGFFHVHTAKGRRTYRLMPGHAPRLVKSEDGKMYSYCIHGRESFPAEDITAAFKLLLDADEKEFLKIANASFIGNSPMPAPSAVPRVRRRDVVTR